MLLDDTFPPNKPIFLENTSITHVENSRLREPCSVNVVLHLSPTIACRIESDNLPIQLMKNYQNKIFLVTLENGCNIKVLLSYSLNDFFHNRNSKETFKGFLFPYMSPCTVAQLNTLIKSVSFCILNFKSFYGSRDKRAEVNENHRWLGATEMEYGPWRIDITEIPTFFENRKILEQEDGYSVSHTGSIKHSDGETFSVREAENILTGLRTFLSFASGSVCGLTLVKAVDKYDRELVLEWGTSHVEPWSQGTRSWLPIIDGGDSLSQLFPGFWHFYDNPDWRNTLSTVIDWYFNSSNSPAHVGIILTQAALESLSYKIIREKLPAEEIKKLSTGGKKLRKLLEIIEIDKEIPSLCEGLKNFSRKKIKLRRDENKSCYMGDGPEAIVQIRNDLIHAEKKHSPISAEAQIDAIRLSRWYIELILLKKFGYQGRYMNGLRNQYEHVPWVDKNLEATITTSS